MTVLDIALSALALFGLLFGFGCYIELWKWARQCQHGRIVISVKRKVVLQAPIVEWLLWANNAEKDKASHGRTVFSRNGVSVSVISKVVPPGRVRSAVRRVRGQHGSQAPPVNTITK